MATKKTKSAGKAKKVVREEDFDSSRLHLFKVDVIPGPGIRSVLEAKCKGETYDELLDAFEKPVKEKFPEEYFPKLDFDYDSFRIVEDGKEYPVFPESGAKDALKRLGKNAPGKYLVLPECTYSLAPEYKLYLSLCEKGIIDEETTPYDSKKMSDVLAKMGGGGKS